MEEKLISKNHFTARPGLVSFRGFTRKLIKIREKIFNFWIECPLIFLPDSTLNILLKYNVANVIQTYLSFINSKTPKFFYFLTNLENLNQVIHILFSCSIKCLFVSLFYESMRYWWKIRYYWRVRKTYDWSQLEIPKESNWIITNFCELHLIPYFKDQPSLWFSNLTLLVFLVDFNHMFFSFVNNAEFSINISSIRIINSQK
jgi:hypothetical protein